MIAPDVVEVGREYPVSCLLDYDNWVPVFPTPHHHQDPEFFGHAAIVQAARVSYGKYTNKKSDDRGLKRTGAPRRSRCGDSQAIFRVVLSADAASAPRYRRVGNWSCCRILGG